MSLPENLGLDAAGGVGSSMHAPSPLTAAGTASTTLATPADIAHKGYPNQPRSSLAGLHFNRKGSKGDQGGGEPSPKGTKRQRTQSTSAYDPQAPDGPRDDEDEVMDDLLNHVADTSEHEERDRPPAGHGQTGVPPSTVALSLDHDSTGNMQLYPATNITLASIVSQAGVGEGAEENPTNPRVGPNFDDFMPTPVDGFPEIHGWNKEKVFEGLDGEQRDLWMEELWIYFSRIIFDAEASRSIVVQSRTYSYLCGPRQTEY